MKTIILNTDLFLCGMFFFAVALWAVLLRMFYLWYMEEFPTKGKKNGKNLLKIKAVNEVLLMLFLSLCLASGMECKGLEVSFAEKTLLIYIC